MKRIFAVALSFAVATQAPTSAAQSQFDCPVVPAESSFVVDGQSLLGPLVNSLGAPAHMEGTCGLELVAGSNGEMLFKIGVLEVLTVDDLHLEVPCPPLVPTPLRVAVEGLRVRVDSNAFARTPGGQVDMQTFGTILGGELSLTLLGGQVLHQSLAGTDIAVTARTGSLTSGNAGAGVELDLPLEFELLGGQLGSLYDLGLHLDGRILARSQYPSPISYCVASVNSIGCSAGISSSGTPSTTAGNGFVIHASDVRNRTQGQLFFGTSGRAVLPFHGGTLCVAPPLFRTRMQFAGGAGAPIVDCSGVLGIDFNDVLSELPVTAEQRVPGTQFQCQWWSRDPNVASTVVFSNALEFTLGL